MIKAFLTLTGTFAGDCAGHLNVLFPFPARAAWDEKTALASADRLTKLEPFYLAPWHGAVLKEPVAMMQRAIRKAFKAAKYK